MLLRERGRRGSGIQIFRSFLLFLKKSILTGGGGGEYIFPFLQGSGRPGRALSTYAIIPRPDWQDLTHESRQLALDSGSPKVVV